MSHIPVFNLPEASRLADMIRKDLAAAKSAWIQEAERDEAETRRRKESDFLSSKNFSSQELDLHSLRHTCGAWLAQSGAHPKSIQTVMRHSSITLTMDTYGHLFPGQEAATVAGFPDMLGINGKTINDNISENILAERGSYSGSNQGAFPCVLRASQCEMGSTAEQPAIGCNPVITGDLCETMREDATKSENAPSRARTVDPLIKSQLLYQLS